MLQLLRKHSAAVANKNLVLAKASYLAKFDRFSNVQKDFDLQVLKLPSSLGC